jgi:hypothetical protein
MYFNDASLTLMVGTGLFLSFLGAGFYAFNAFVKEKLKKA